MLLHRAGPGPAEQCTKGVGDWVGGGLGKFLACATGKSAGLQAGADLLGLVVHTI